MKARPILFSGPMVRALLEGRKTQTRRILKQPKRKDGAKLSPELLQQIGVGAACPYGQPGDLLWVRETIEKATERGGVGYPADGTWLPNAAWAWGRKTIPSIFMPREFSRLTLELTNVRVAHLHSISEDDCMAEGIFTPECAYAQHGSRAGLLNYAALWDSIHGAGSWHATTWVWALEFKVHKQNVDQLLKQKGAENAGI